MKPLTLVDDPHKIVSDPEGETTPSLGRMRRKRHLAWEEAELSLGGFYARNLESVRDRFPQLSPMELRVCALAKALLPSWRIGEILGISTKTVENHFRNTRIKLGLPRGTRMHRFLAMPEKHGAKELAEEPIAEKNRV